MATGAVGLLDTSVLIDLLRGKSPQAITWLKELPYPLKRYGVPLVCHAEIIVGARTEGNIDKTRYNTARELLARFEPIDTVDMEWAYIQFERLWLSHQIGFADCLIASVAYKLDIPLFSTDKHFQSLLSHTMAILPY